MAEESERKSNRLAKKQLAKSSITQEDPSMSDEITNLRREISELKRSLKEELLAELAQVRAQEIDAILTENKELKEKLNKSNSILKNLKEKLKKQNDELAEVKDNLYEIEVSHDRLEQYTRRNNLEIAGIDDKIPDKDLENHIIGILKDVGVTVSEQDIEACHRLPKSTSAKSKNLPKRSIIRFVNRKHVEKALRKKKLLHNTRKGIYFNENLCSNYRDIWFKCRDLHRSNRIYSYHTYNGTVFYRISESSKPTKVNHITDLDSFDISDDVDWGCSDDWGDREE